MFGILASILVIFSLLAGGGGIAVAAAQDSQPDQALYPLKTWSEQIRTDLTTHPDAQINLKMEYSNRRVEEIRSMLADNKTPPEAVQANLRSQIQQAMSLAVNQPDKQAVWALTQVRQRLQEQNQEMLQTGANGSAQAEETRSQVYAMLQEQLRLVEAGIQDPQMLRQQLRQSSGSQPGAAPWMTNTPGTHRQNGNGPETNPSLTPVQGKQAARTSTSSPASPAGQGEGQNPWTDTTPTPGSGYGPGPGGSENPWTDTTPTPGSGYGPGPGGSENPWTDTTPTPGSGYGPGPGSSEDPNPGMGGNGPGPQPGGNAMDPTQPAMQNTPGMPGGNGGSGGSGGGMGGKH